MQPDQRSTARFPNNIYLLPALPCGIKIKIWVVEVVAPLKMALPPVVARVKEVVPVAVATG
jgi:hypothetical protein